MNINISDSQFLNQIALTDLSDLVFKFYSLFESNDYTEEEFITKFNHMFFTSKAKNIIFKSSFLQNLKIHFNEHESPIISDKENIYTKQEFDILFKIGFVTESFDLTDKGYSILKSVFTMSDYLDLEYKSDEMLQNIIFKMYLSSN